jgi:hypothetical protein
MIARCSTVLPLPLCRCALPSPNSGATHVHVPNLLSPTAPPQPSSQVPPTLAVSPLPHGTPPQLGALATVLERSRRLCCLLYSKDVMDDAAVELQLAK